MLFKCRTLSSDCLSNAPPKEQSSLVAVVCNKACHKVYITVRGDINSRWKATLDAGYSVHGTLKELEIQIN